MSLLVIKKICGRKYRLYDKYDTRYNTKEQVLAIAKEQKKRYGKGGKTFIEEVEEVGYLLDKTSYYYLWITQ